MMEYTLSKTQRNSIILCSSFLILYVILTNLLFLIHTPAKIGTAEVLIRNVIYLIPFGYLMLAFYKYFGHYKMKILQISVLLIFVKEFLSRSTLFTHLFESAWKRIVFASVSTLWIAAMIVLIVGLSKKQKKFYPGMISIRNYALSTLIIFVFATTFPFYLKPVNLLDAQLLFGMTSAIPFIIIIGFAIKLKLIE